MNTQNLIPIQPGEARNPQGSSKKARARAAAKREAQEIIGNLAADYIQQSDAGKILFWDKFLALATEEEYRRAVEQPNLPLQVKATIRAILREYDLGEVHVLAALKQRILGTRIVAEFQKSQEEETKTQENSVPRIIVLRHVLVPEEIPDDYDY